MDLVALDIGGTNARFALASVGSGGTIALGEPVTLATSDHVSLATAWEEFARLCARDGRGDLPRAAAIAIAAPVTGQIVRMTNNSWVLDTGALDAQLGLDRVTLINDFGAVAHAVARADEAHLLHLAGPEGALPATGTVSVIGAGTGLGVAHYHRPSAWSLGRASSRSITRWPRSRSAAWRISTTARSGRGGWSAAMRCARRRWTASACRWAAWRAIMRWRMGAARW